MRFYLTSAEQYYYFLKIGSDIDILSQYPIVQGQFVISIHHKSLLKIKLLASCPPCKCVQCFFIPTCNSLYLSCYQSTIVMDCKLLEFQVSASKDFQFFFIQYCISLAMFTFHYFIQDINEKSYILVKVERYFFPIWCWSIYYHNLSALKKICFIKYFVICRFSQVLYKYIMRLCETIR